VIPQAASDIHNAVSVTNEILGSQLPMLSIHAIRQSMIGHGHDKYVVPSVEESCGDLLEGRAAAGITMNEDNGLHGLGTVRQQDRVTARIEIDFTGNRLRLVTREVKPQCLQFAVR
jgi:hypothetical protein